MKTSCDPIDAINNAIAFISQHSGTSGSRALARVLLHAHNHIEQPLDIAELCVLDQPYEEWAWAILHFRTQGNEPERYVSDKAAFKAIIDDYWL